MLGGDLCSPQSECACTPQCSHTQIMEMANCGETEFAFTSLKLFGNSQLFDKGENLLYLKGMKPRRKDYFHKINVKMKKIRRIFLRCPSHHSGGGSDRTAEPLLISALRSLEYHLLSISLEYFAPSSSNVLCTKSHFKYFPGIFCCHHRYSTEYHFFASLWSDALGVTAV